MTNSRVCIYYDCKIQKDIINDFPEQSNLRLLNIMLNILIYSRIDIEIIMIEILSSIEC